MKQVLRIIIALFPVLYASVGYAQINACNSAQNACANPGFSLTGGGGTGLPGNLNISNPGTNPQNGNGANPNAAFPNSGCLLSNGPGPNWMILTVSTTGMLGFSFGASSSAPGTFPQSGLYDWAMWPYNPTTCTNIFNNTLPPVACNWNGSSVGGTGMGVPTPSAMSSTGVNLPAGDPSNFQPSIPVTAGDQFIILLSNYSGVTASVTIAKNGSADIACSPLILPSFIRCPGQPAVMTATWAAQVTNVSYTLAAAMPLIAGNFTVQSSPTFVVAPAATQVYTVIAAGSNTLNAVVTTSNTFTVTISPTTTMSAAWTENVCNGSSATFTAQSSGTGYTLTPPSGPVVTSAIQILSTPPLTSSGIYTLGTTLFSGCTATTAMNVSVAPAYSIQVNPPLNVCLNTTAQLTASLTNSTGYSWTGPNWAGSTISNPVISGNDLSLSASGVYMVNSSAAFGTTTCPVTATTQISVIATSPVGVSASPSTVICQGSSVQLSSNITGIANMSWAGPNSFAAAASTATVSNMVPASDGVYTATAVFSNAVASCVKTNTVMVHVVATADPTITVPPILCQNTTAHFSVAVSTLPSGPQNVLWTGPAGFSTTGTSFNRDSIQPIASGSYYAYVFYANYGKTCQTQATGQLNVVPVNNISIIPVPPVCRPNDVAIHASAVGAVSYNWVGPNNFSDHQAHPILSHPDVNASGIYTVTVGFGLANSSLICYNTNTVQVVVNPILNFQLTGFQMACAGSSLTIQGPPGADSYSWTSSSGMTSNQRDLVIPAAGAVDEGMYFLSVSLGPCITSNSSSVQIVKHIEQTFEQQSMTICKGEAVTFKTEFTEGSHNYAVEWYPSAYLNSSTGLTQENVRPQGTTIYTTRAYDPVCADYAISRSFTVNVLEVPRSRLELEKNDGCVPLTLFYNSKIQRNNSLITYDFINNNNGQSRRFQNDSFYYSITDPGIYTVRVRTTLLFENDKVCSDSVDYPAPVVVNPKPGADILWYPETPTLSENNVQFTPSIRNGEVVSQKWIFSGTYNDTVKTASPRRVFEYTGRYPVTLVTTNSYGCTDTVVKYIEISDDFNVYIPNSFTPNGDNLNDMFQMKGSGIKQESFSMDVFDRWGSLLFSTKDPTKGWDGSTKGQSAPEGVYVYKIKLSGVNGEAKKEYMGQMTLIR